MSQPLEMHGQHGGDPDTDADDAETAIDPVCGMTVNRDSARNRGLALTHGGNEYFFCGRGCKLDFQEDPAKYLTPGYQPHM